MKIELTAEQKKYPLNRAGLPVLEFPRTRTYAVHCYAGLDTLTGLPRFRFVSVLARAN